MALVFSLVGHARGAHFLAGHLAVLVGVELVEVGGQALHAGGVRLGPNSSLVLHRRLRSCDPLAGQDGKLIYKGLVDDDQKNRNAEKRNNYLRDVLGKLLKNEKVEPFATKEEGCSIKRLGAKERGGRGRGERGERGEGKKKENGGS